MPEPEEYGEECQGCKEYGEDLEYRGDQEYGEDQEYKEYMGDEEYVFLAR
jgi:hypothetical protein